MYFILPRENPLAAAINRAKGIDTLLYFVQKYPCTLCSLVHQYYKYVKYS